MINLSASSINCFKACPMRYYYQYILGLVPIEDTDSQRMGTNWHRIQEIADMKPGGTCECVTIHGADWDSEVANPHCALCSGTGQLPDDIMDAVIAHLNQAYATPPINKTIEEWEVERTQLLYSLIGYQWYYQDTEYETEQLEQKFELPLYSPRSNRPLQANLRGKIDRIFSAGNNRFVHEYKSTSKSIDPDSTYWNHLTLDTQTRLYTLAAQQLGLGMCGVLYDVWHKPKTSPKLLTQADSKKFVDDGEYCGEKFNILGGPYPDELYVNDKSITHLIKPGAKEGTFAIRETPEMYGARLLQDITENPEKHFARKELAHTQGDIESFRWQLFNIYSAIKVMNKTNGFWRNENQCEATFKCSYIPFCYNNVNLGPDDCPENFKKLGDK
jgi:hypothetical protein